MSSPLAVAAVTATLKDLLNEGLINHDLATVGSFSVTASPPDRITTGQNEPNQLNLFLYQVTPNPGWRNADLPSRDAQGGRLANPPLALDLHYMLSAYGSEDLNAEILLGYAMQLLHETPILTRAQLRATLGGTPLVDGTILPGPFGALSAIDLADQLESIKISPVYLSSEELSKLWTAMQARYRPTMAYMVSVVLIQSEGPVRAAPPVLSRGPAASASGAPFLTAVRPAASDLLPAMRLGDDLVLTGTSLGTTGMTATLENARLGLSQEIPVNTVGGRLIVHVPTTAQDDEAANRWGVGAYAVSVREAGGWSTNAVPIALSPTISISPNAAVAGTFDLTVACLPRIRPEQEAGIRLVFGSRTIKANSISTPDVTPADRKLPTTLVFTVDEPDAGAYLVRLRVDGIDSLPIKLVGSPPTLEFDDAQKVVLT